MELLIPGLILVALMIYASTRIKKTAAAAFEFETIETDQFIIQKPEGFLHNLNGDPKYVFEAYSKDFSKANDKLRAGTATITWIENTTLKSVVNEMMQSDNLTEQGTEMFEGNQYRVFELNEGVEAETSYKLAERKGSVYKLEVTASKESQNRQWAETFLDSFRVK